MKTSIKQYAQALYELTKDKPEDEVSVVVEKFIANLKEKRLLGKAKDIIKEFKKIYNQKNGIVQAKVQTARELDKISQEKIIEFIKNKYQAKEVDLLMEISPKLQGGLRITVGDEVIDGSVLGRLRKLRSSLAE